MILITGTYFFIKVCSRKYFYGHSSSTSDSKRVFCGERKKYAKYWYNLPLEACSATKWQGGPRGRVVKVADFSALNHSIISPLWVRASLGARVTCGTSQVLLAGVSGGFSPGTPVFAPPTD